MVPRLMTSQSFWIRILIHPLSNWKHAASRISPRRQDASRLHSGAIARRRGCEGMSRPAGGRLRIVLAREDEIPFGQTAKLLRSNGGGPCPCRRRGSTLIGPRSIGLLRYSIGVSSLTSHSWFHVSMEARVLLHV